MLETQEGLNIPTHTHRLTMMQGHRSQLKELLTLKLEQVEQK